LFAERGVSLIDLKAGAAAFVDELRQPPSDDHGAIEIILGAGLAASTPAQPSAAVDLYLNPSEHAYLNDHRVRGAVVLPVAVAVELLGRACRAAYPSLTLQRLSSLRVLKGITFDRSLRQGAWLKVQLEQKSNGDGATVALTLTTEDDRPRYSAVAELGREPAPSHWSPAASNGSNGGRPSPYGGVLFHGPSLQVLERVTAVDGAGARAEVRGHGFAMRDFVIDAGLIDGALQLALLWTEERLGGASLPTAVAHVEIHQHGAIDGTVSAELCAREDTGGRRGVCDVHLRREDGLPVATLRGVETHLLPPPTPSVRAPRP
jgi:hypothetical protein